jgi:hypothetical protein
MLMVMHNQVNDWMVVMVVDRLKWIGVRI